MSEMARIMYPVKKITGLILFDSLITGNQLALIDASKHIILPCLTLAAYPIGLVARMTRSSLLEVLNEDYIRAARAYGLPERMVVLSYALKNALGPTITTCIIGWIFACHTFRIEAILLAGLEAIHRFRHYWIIRLLWCYNIYCMQLCIFEPCGGSPFGDPRVGYKGVSQLENDRFEILRTATFN